MRFSAVQEDGYGICLKQDEQHLNNINNNNNVDDSMMAATGEIQPVGEDTAEDCSMIYNLPLLFANGYPTSLENITLPQLERFITFMITCSMDQNNTQQARKPIWWPNEVEFSFPLVKPSDTGDDWFENLKKLVFRCYNYHRSEYLLRFCSYLAQYPRDKLYYVNNWNSTTSLFHKSSKKLLATFRNENMNYDKATESPRKSLLAQNNVNSGLSNKHKKNLQKMHRQSSSSLVVIQPQMEEIYLCDNCDAEFDTLDQMKDHEKACGELLRNSSVSRSITPCESEVELNENQFLDYFHLIAANQLANKSTLRAASTIYIETETTRSSRRIRPSINLTRYPTIPFSSPAGLAMVKKSKGMTYVTQQERLDRVERYMNAPPLSKTTKPKWFDKIPQSTRWAVTYKPNKDSLAHDDFVHQYTFGAVKRKPALSIRSQLLYIACRPIYVRLERLNSVEIEDLMFHPWKYKCPSPRVSLRHKSRIVMRIGSKSIGGVKRKYYSNVQELPIKENAAKGSIQSDDMPQMRGRQSAPAMMKGLSDQNKTIILVDLCSSDEEDTNADNPILSDENRDPLNMKRNENSSRIVCLKTLGLQPTKCLSNGLGFSHDSLNERLRDSILTDDNDKSSNNKCLVNSVIDNCKNFSPIFKPSS